MALYLIEAIEAFIGHHGNINPKYVRPFFGRGELLTYRGLWQS